jgi:hypothetical protein
MSMLHEVLDGYMRRDAGFDDTDVCDVCIRAVVHPEGRVTWYFMARVYSASVLGSVLRPR